MSSLYRGLLMPLAVLLVVAVALRLVWLLLEPVLVPLSVLAVVGFGLYAAVRRQR